MSRRDSEPTTFTIFACGAPAGTRSGALLEAVREKLSPTTSGPGPSLSGQVVSYSDGSQWLGTDLDVGGRWRHFLGEVAQTLGCSLEVVRLELRYAVLDGMEVEGPEDVPEHLPPEAWSETWYAVGPDGRWRPGPPARESQEIELRTHPEYPVRF